jgi:putative flippase GtrA
MLAKAVAVAAAFPIGFFGNRAFTFGSGVAALFARIGGRR